jgi:hypothetical protein
MVMMVVMVMIMMVVMVMRGLRGDRESGDAHGDDGGGEKLLDHVGDFQSRVPPQPRGFTVCLP